MIKIPNFGHIDAKYLLIDFNGTIAKDGKMFNVIERLLNLDLEVIIITGDTYGNVRKLLEPYPIECAIAYTAIEKENYILEKGPDKCIAIGNGNIDYKMLKHAAIGIAILEDEGVSTKAILNADLLVKSINDALGLIENPKRLIATLKE